MALVTPLLFHPSVIHEYHDDAASVPNDREGRLQAFDRAESSASGSGGSHVFDRADALGAIHDRAVGQRPFNVGAGGAGLRIRS